MGSSLHAGVLQMVTSREWCRLSCVLGHGVGGESRKEAATMDQALVHSRSTVHLYSVGIIHLQKRKA